MGKSVGKVGVEMTIRLAELKKLSRRNKYGKADWLAVMECDGRYKSEKKVYFLKKTEEAVLNALAREFACSVK